MTTGLPLGWRIAPLGEVADTSLGKMLDAARPKGAEPTPYLRNMNVQWDSIDLDDVKSVPLSEAERSRFSLAAGDLLVCEGGEPGRAAIWPGTVENMAFQKALHRVRSRGDLDLRWLRYFLEYSAKTGALAAHMTGTTIKHLPQSNLRELPLPLPPLAEQRRIVDLLESHLSHLDVARAGLHQVRARQSQLKAAQSEQIRLSASEGHDVRLADLSTTAGHGTSAKCIVGGLGQPVVRIPNLVHGKIDLSDEKRVAAPDSDVERLMLQQGDLLIVRTNGSRDLIGRTALVQDGIKAAFASYLIRYRLDAARVRPAWVRLMLETPTLRRVIEGMAASSAGQYNLGLKKLDTIVIPLPPLDVQDRMLTREEEMSRALDRVQREVCMAEKRAATLHRALLAAAFDGRLTAASRPEELADV